MRIWVLAKKKGFKSYGNKRLVAEANRLGIEIKMVAPEDFEIIEPNRSGQKEIVFKNKWTELPDCLIPRLGSSTSYFALAVIRYFERMGVFVCNSSQAVESAKDKLHTIQILAQNNIPIPKTMLAKFPLKASFIKKEFKFPLILKMISGSQGRGVMLCNNMSELADIGHLTGQSSETKMNLILQEFISASRGKDIRVFIVGGRVMGAMMRKAQSGKFKANFSAGGSVEKFELTSEIEWLALECARLLNLDITGVDILFDKEGFRVCEVNSSPGFEGFEEATGINIPEEIFAYIKVRLEGSLPAAK